MSMMSFSVTSGRRHSPRVPSTCGDVTVSGQFSDVGQNRNFSGPCTKVVLFGLRFRLRVPSWQRDSTAAVPDAVGRVIEPINLQAIAARNPPTSEPANNYFTDREPSWCRSVESLETAAQDAIWATPHSVNIPSSAISRVLSGTSS